MEFKDFLDRFGLTNQGMEYLKANKIWVTKDNVPMAIAKMHDTYLANAIALLKREKGDWRIPFLPLLEAEQKEREATYVNVDFMRYDETCNGFVMAYAHIKVDDILEWGKKGEYYFIQTKDHFYIVTLITLSGVIKKKSQLKEIRKGH